MADEIVVELGERSYPIVFRYDALGEVGAFAQRTVAAGRCVVLSDDNVAPLYGDRVEESLREAGFEPQTMVIPPGEEQKSLDTYGRLCRELVAAGLDRSSALFALGGGVVGDLGGFLAATYMRGIPYMQIPTTLLAQVDSSVGGKTAVNLPEGKNLVGAFHQPKGVFIDTSVLTTLDEREMRAGMVEVVKYGLIRDRDFFEWLETNLDAILQLQPSALLHAVRRSCEIKADVVATDEREAGLRAILNYGHTIGHALEALGRYERLKHGEAVAMGMEVAALLSRRIFDLDEEEARRQHAVLERLRVPTQLQGVSAAEIAEAVLRDKKTVGGEPRFVLCRSIGEAQPGVNVPPDLLRDALVQCGAAA